MTTPSITPKNAAALGRCGITMAMAAMLAIGPVPFLAHQALAQEGQSALVDAVGNDTRIETVIGMIEGDFPGKVNIYGKATGQRVTVMRERVPIEDALTAIANSVPGGLVWWRDKNGVDFGIADREYYERNILVGDLIQKVFRPNNIKASELDRAIKGLLTPNLASSVADDRTNKLIINDLPQALERIERFIREIDVQLIVRVFYIRHADVEDIAKKIENYKSDPGTIEVDVKTHQIIVTDLLSNIKKMELLIDILDVGPDIVIYDVNNIGIDGRDLEDLQKIIDSIRTKDLLFEVNDKQGVFILEDVPEVHERVEQILAEFDRPVRQVLLQAEILSTSYARDFALGVKRFGLVEDLPGAVAGGAIPGGAIPGGFTDIYRRFPNLSLVDDGKAATTTGRFLSTNAYLELEATYSDNRTRVLLQPRLLVKNQETSEIFVGADEPFLTTFRDTGGTGTDRDTFTTTQSSIQSGLRFEVTPSISNSYLIEMELAIDNDAAERLPDSDLIRKDRQNVKTTLQIPSGRTRLIGGLIRNSESDSARGFPFLSSLPVIGYIFGTKSHNRSATNLVLFITPSVVEEDELRRSESGRRGRAVTSMGDQLGQFDLQLGRDDFDSDDPELRSFMEGLDPNEILSGDVDDEMEAIRIFREREARRRQAAEESGSSNYIPSAGFGSATLNTREQPVAPNERGARRGGTDRWQGRGGVPMQTLDGERRPATSDVPPPPRAETNYQ